MESLHMENEITEGIQNSLQQIHELATKRRTTIEAAARQVAEKRLSVDTQKMQI